MIIRKQNSETLTLQLISTHYRYELDDIDPTLLQVKGVKISFQDVPDTDRHLKWHGNFLSFHFYLIKIDAN